ncbi:MAG: biotin--[acetyl-CoA-carboxylase] ligase, partial [Micavibrio aeruginosavorus]
MAVHWQIEVFDTLPSTMDVLRKRGESGADEGLVIQAYEQTNGKGRHGNVWTGLSGNLFCSILIRHIDLKTIGHYSFVVSVALANTVMPLLKNDHFYTHKWPNDGMIDGQKFAGILLQTEDDFLNI